MVGYHSISGMQEDIAAEKFVIRICEIKDGGRLTMKVRMEGKNV